MTPTNSQPAIDSVSRDQVLGAIGALSQLLALNSSIEHARAEISQPFHVTANRVTERAHPDAGGANTLRTVAAPSSLAIALDRDSALLRIPPADAVSHLAREKSSAQNLSAQNLSTQDLSERAG